MQRKLLGIVSVVVDAAGQLLIMCSAFVIYLRKLEHSEAVHQLYIDFKKACDLFSRDVLFKIPIQFGTPVKLVRLIKMGLNETCSRVSC
jgi:hypothetical protein